MAANPPLTTQPATSQDAASMSFSHCMQTTLGSMTDRLGRLLLITLEEVGQVSRHRRSRSSLRGIESTSSRGSRSPRRSVDPARWAPRSHRRLARHRERPGYRLLGFVAGGPRAAFARLAAERCLRRSPPGAPASTRVLPMEL